MFNSIKINKENVEAAVLGGAVLGGGGGGWIEDGKNLAKIALQNGFSQIVPLDTLDENTMLVTVSAVGAPSEGSNTVKPEDYVRAVELLREGTGINIGGLISSEIGALGVVNGWIQSAVLKIPLVDSPCNGRAHPLGLMGSMGLHKVKDYVSIQSVVGGQGDTHIEALFKNSLEKASQKVLERAARARGMVAVARNPVSVGYVKTHGAPNAISMAIKLGKVMLENKQASPEKMINSIKLFFGGDFIFKGKVKQVSSQIEEGLDTGKIDIDIRSEQYKLTFWNEYMTLEDQRQRIATFPDLIMTFDAKTGNPLISTEIQEKQEIIIIVVSAKRLILGAGVKDRKLLKRIEKNYG